jgi:aryl carrier-like protein
VAQNPEVLTAIVVGAQRFQAALMLEPAPNAAPQSTAEEAAFIERVWPSIQGANKAAPAHARIEKAMILPMSPEKPVIRAGKGTMQRAATLQQYSTELDKLYRNADMDLDRGPDHIGSSARIQGIEAISQIVRTAVAQALEKTEVGDHDDFFAIGADSLQALIVTRKLRQSLRIPDIAIATIYSNPSVARLSNAVHSLQLSWQASQAPDDQTRAQSITSMLEEYRARIRKIPRSNRREEQPEKTTVILTGSTGTLGTYLLGALLDDPTVDHVYCLNRRDASREIRQRCNEATGLPLGSIDARVRPSPHVQTTDEPVPSNSGRAERRRHSC